MAQIHKGMEVITADGRLLGKVAHVWLGTDPTIGQPYDEEVSSQMEVHLPHRGGVRYIPSGAIDGVSGRIVNLAVTATAVNDKLWHQRPGWLPPEVLNEDIDHLVRPHPEYGGY
jgi:hypothetical protein